MTTYKLAYVCIKFISLVCLLMIVTSIGQAWQWGVIFSTDVFSAIRAFTPVVLYVALFVITWFFAGAIARKLIRQEDFAFEVHLPGMFPVAIALIGIYLLAVDVSTLFMVTAEFIGESVAEGFEVGNLATLLAEATATVVSMLIDVFLILKAGWIASKVRAIWDKHKDQREMRESRG